MYSHTFPGQRVLLVKLTSIDGTRLATPYSIIDLGSDRIRYRAAVGHFHSIEKPGVNANEKTEELKDVLNGHVQIFNK